MSGGAEGSGRRRAPVGAIIAVGAILAVLLVVAALFARGALLDAKLARRKAEIRAAGLPAGMQDIIERRNADPLAVLAAEELLACLEEVSGAGDRLAVMVGDRGGLGVRHSDIVRPAAAAAAEASADQMARLRSALGPVPAYPLPAAGQPLDWSLERPGGLRSAAWALSVVAAIRAEMGDVEGAARELVTILRLADSLGEEPLLGELLAMAAVDDTGVQAIEETLSLAELPADALVGLGRLLALKPPSPEAGLLSQRALAFGVLGEARALELVTAYGPGHPVTRALGQLELGVPGRRAAEALYFDAVTEECLAACLPGLRERRLAAERLREGPGKAMEEGRKARFAAAIPTLSGARCLEASISHGAELWVAATALAIERWRMEHGEWPESLEQLVPGLLEEVPEDPYSEDKLLYRRTDEGVVVYSVGKDGTDEGGLAWSEAPGPARLRGRGYDLPFRLLDPERRGGVTLSFREDVMGSGMEMEPLERAGFTEQRLLELGLTEDDLAELRWRSESKARRRP
jgi:hypothetical protein